MKRDRYIRVPRDAKAMRDYDYGIQKDDQVVEWILNETEYNCLDNLGVFQELNIACDVIIDDFEEDIIALDKLESANNRMIELINCADSGNKDCFNNLKKLQDLILLALKFKTLVAFDF